MKEHCWHENDMSCASAVYYPDGYVPKFGKAICCHCGKQTSWKTKSVRCEGHGDFFPVNRTVYVYDDVGECKP